MLQCSTPHRRARWLASGPASLCHDTQIRQALLSERLADPAVRRFATNGRARAEYCDCQRDTLRQRRIGGRRLVGHRFSKNDGATPAEISGSPRRGWPARNATHCPRAFRRPGDQPFRRGSSGAPRHGQRPQPGPVTAQIWQCSDSPTRRTAIPGFEPILPC